MAEKAGMVQRRSLERRIGVDPDQLSGLLGAVEAFASEAGLADLTASRLLLVVEELVVNTMTHGRDGRPPATEIRISLRAEPGSIAIIAEDDGVAFDPTRRPGLEGSLSLDDRTPGGLGLHLVSRVASEICYQRRQSRNRITCRVAAPT